MFPSVISNSVDSFKKILQADTSTSWFMTGTASYSNVTTQAKPHSKGFMVLLTWPAKRNELKNLVSASFYFL
jgi:hypothetical protein